jgi:gluconolactonase
MPKARGHDLVVYCAQLETRRREMTMIYLETPPKLIATTIFTAMPDHFRRKGTSRQWNNEWKPGNE